jgi:type II secretory pathway pseudopilin PulG
VGAELLVFAAVVGAMFGFLLGRLSAIRTYERKLKEIQAQLSIADDQARQLRQVLHKRSPRG